MRRRGRGNNRKPGSGGTHHHHHQGRNQTFDSNGPGVRLRGTAHQLYEKYQMLGRDASSSGDRIMSENYLQHADHFYRIILASQGPLEQFSDRSDRNEGGDPELGNEGNYGHGEQPAMGDTQPQGNYGNTLPQGQSFNGAGPSQGTSLPGSGQPRPEGDGNQGGQQQGNFRRDRFNRRFRDRGDRGAERQGQTEGGERQEREPRQDREPRESREPRPEREPRQEREPREGREPRQDREPREGREPRERRDSDRPQRQPRRSEDETFEPPAFLKAERSGADPARDPFNRDEDR